MSDPLRTDPARAGELAPDGDREAKIERLLLDGLDHYLAAHYDQAINIWTRALFLDRSHARARAYIERARGALAERQRESEALLQDGVAAFDRGEADEARRLLEAAIREGAPSDEALAILNRLDRLDAAVLPAEEFPPAKATPRIRPAPPQSRTSRAAWIAVGGLALVILTAAALVVGALRSDWRPLGDRPTPATTALPGRAPGDEAVLPRRAETALTRARALVSTGRLRDALAQLDLVRPTDAQKAEADALRTEVQRQLLDVARAPRTTGGHAPGDTLEP
jgi:hypothetical protein